MRVRTRRARTVAALAATAALALAGCQADAEDTPPADTPSEEATEPADDGGMEATEPADDGAMADAATVALGSTDLGEVLVGPEGMTLYMFDPDAQGDSTCYDQCATAWPPLTLDDGAEPAAGEGVDAALLGTTERTDGTTQVTYDGWPLYYWAQDAAPGDATGQAVNDVWWVLDASGEPIRD